ncbi:MAG: hypothetical protein HFH65_01275 [Lachnospiraceae bacterium]|nr:hypothetical protein [Lachnospiraceae bacterium]
MEHIGDNCLSAFSVVHQCISSVSITELTEEEKKEKLINNLQNFWRGNSPKIAGCKREYIQKIIKLVFGIKAKEEHCMDKDIALFTFKELYLYYCYIEQIAKIDRPFSKLLLISYNAKSKKAIEQRHSKEQRKKEEQEAAEREKLEKMGKEQRWRYEIIEKRGDMRYFQEVVDGKICDEDKLLIARILKEYWETERKWEGDKVSKKQLMKIKQVKEVLGE